MKKKRILFSSEASFTLSGFGKYGREVISRLFDTNKYEIAEFASFAKVGDAKQPYIKWLFYPNAVDPTDPRFMDYDSVPTNKFGLWRFESVLLDFKPDFVVDWRDYWMSAYEGLSPLRPYFHHILMPTIDSAPQQDDWIETYVDADAIFTYSDYGIEVLRKEGKDKVNLQQSTFPGVDLNLFKPVNKREHRKKMLFEEDAFIIGTVMRNQKRKLYPDLFEAFRKFLDRADKKLAEKTFLYIHASYPDMGWNFPALLKEFELGNKVLFTYICQKTGKPFTAFFQDALTYSPHSNAPTGVLPSTKEGLSEEHLADVYNLFDVYIQYSTCEGFGMPMAEAAACGLPIIAVDYSAMSDLLNKTSGFGVKPKLMFKEFESQAYRAYPDNDYCAKVIERVLTLSDKDREKHSRLSREAAEKYYNWDRTAKIWETYFDGAELTGVQGQWETTPPNIFSPNLQPPQNLSNEQAIKWGFANILGEPERANSLMGLNLLRDLNYGSIATGDHRRAKFTQAQVFEMLFKMLQKKHFCEKCRTGILQRDTQLDFLQYAHRRKAEYDKATNNIGV